MDSKTRASADARFQTTLRQPAAVSAHELETRAEIARTAELRAQRLARDAAGTPAPKRAAPSRKSAARRGVGSY